MLEPDLEFGIKLVAKIHAGEVTISCASCNELQKKDLYCSGVSDYPIYTDDEYEVYSCPLKWLTSIVYEFIDELNYYEAFPGTAPKYGEHNSRFWAAVKLYKSSYNRAVDERQNKPSQKQTEATTTSSLSKLREELKRKKNESKRN